MATPYAPALSSVNPFSHNLPLPVTWWAGYFEVDPRTVREWIGRYGIPFYQPGKERYITPSDMFGNVPYIQPGKEPPLEE
jgi:hypothetical protein